MKSHVILSPAQIQNVVHYFRLEDSLFHKHFLLSAMKNALQPCGSGYSDDDVTGIQLAHMLNCNIPSSNPIGQHLVRQQNSITTGKESLIFLQTISSIFMPYDRKKQLSGRSGSALVRFS